MRILDSNRRITSEEVKEKFIVSIVNLAKRNKEYTEEEVEVMRYAL